MEKIHGFTKRQREWFLRRDGHRCMFCVCVEGKWVRCNKTTGLQIHHILPRGFASMHCHDFAINGRTNGITLCELHHIGHGADCDTYVIHPDNIVAFKEYATDHSSFSRMMERREAKNRLGVPYWNTLFDWMLNLLAVRQTKRYELAHPEDIYQEDK